MKLTVLTENTTCCDSLQPEHGLSLYLETQGRRILFDMGQSGTFADNARKLGIDLREVELAVLSHGHYDHGGGLGCFLEENQTAKVYVSRHGFEPHFNAAGRDIGLDRALETHPRLVFTQGEQNLGDGLHLTNISCPPSDPAGQTMEEKGSILPEDFRHEQYLLIEEAGKRILVSGCSHKGVLNILEAFRPDMFIGGFHFMKITDEEVLTRAARTLAGFDTVYYTGHCTGLWQYQQLKVTLGNRLHSLCTGAVYNL